MNSNKLSIDTGLIPLQEKAIYLLACGKSITEIAKEIKTDRTTLYNWQKLSEFEAYYNKVRLEFKIQANNELVSLFSDALSVLNESLQSENENIKLKACIYILGHVQEFPTGPTTKEGIDKEKMLKW